MNGQLPARNGGQTKIGNFTGRPLRAMVNLAAEKDACAHIVADVDEDEVLNSLSGTAKVLALRSQVRIVLDDHRAARDLAEHGAQRNRAPAL